MNQKAFSFDYGYNYNPDNYIITETNKEAFSIINNWPLSWGHQLYPNIVLLKGPKLSGKTYLSYIWQKKSNGHRIKKVDDIKNNNIIIEDIDNSVFSESELLHIFNLCHESKIYCLFTATKYPVNFELNDLSSRINSIRIINMYLPDIETMKNTLLNEFAKRSIKVADNVINYLLYNAPRDFYELNQIINKVDKISLQLNTKITIPLLKKYLFNLNNHKSQY